MRKIDKAVQALLIMLVRRILLLLLRGEQRLFEDFVVLSLDGF